MGNVGNMDDADIGQWHSYCAWLEDRGLTPLPRELAQETPREATSAKEAPPLAFVTSGRSFLPDEKALFERMTAAMKLTPHDYQLWEIPAGQKELPEALRNKPARVIALGGRSAQLLLGQNEIESLRGRWHNGPALPAHAVAVTYHPGALLREPSLKRPCWQDLQFAMGQQTNEKQHTH